MTYNFYSSSKEVTLPHGCSYCNSPSAAKSYELKKTYSHGTSGETKLSISVPVCEKCLKEIRTKVAISRVLGNLLFWLVTGVSIYMINLTNFTPAAKVYAIAFGVYFLFHVFLYNIIFVDSQRPAKFRRGKLYFRNKDYQEKFKIQNQIFYKTE